MKPRKIQVSGVPLLTPFFVLIMSGLALLTPQHINAQCPSGNSLQSVSYPATLTGTGTGSYTLTLPQFDPGPNGYTLLAAVFTSRATTSNTITFTNTTASEQDFVPQISRTDNLKLNGSTVYGGSAQYNGYDFTALDPAGSPGDNITYGPDNIYDNTLIFSDSITNSSTLTGKYQGTGSLNLTYSSTFFVNNVQLGVTSSPNLSDNITLNLTYYFCNPTTLSSNILTFTAEKESNQTVELKWMTSNEQPGRKYFVEVSTGGQDFAITGSVPSDASTSEASYDYSYPIPPTATGKLYFRLRQVEPNGTATWSEVRIVNLDGNGYPSFTIYPNPPSDFINLAIPGDNRDWQVDIIAADGSLVQRNYYRNSNSARVNFVRRLSAGAYFVRAISPQTGKHYTGSFLIR